MKNLNTNSNFMLETSGGGAKVPSLFLQNIMINKVSKL